MGPRLNSRGDEPYRDIARLTIQRLQWGRDLIVAETKDGEDCLLAVYKLQWGRDLIVAETARSSRRLASTRSASMGPRLNSRGDWRKSFRIKKPRLGFNGAAT